MKFNESTRQDINKDILDIEKCISLIDSLRCRYMRDDHGDNYIGKESRKEVIKELLYWKCILQTANKE